MPGFGLYFLFLCEEKVVLQLEKNLSPIVITSVTCVCACFHLFLNSSLFFIQFL